MAQIPLFRAAGVLALALGLAASAAETPAPPAKDDAANKRIVYIVKHGSAKDLAAVLAAHFKGVAEVQALPDASLNCLLISAAPSAFDNVVKTLAQLDRRPQTVSLEIIIANVAPPKDGDKPADAVLEKDFTGDLADVNAKVESLQSKGVFGDVKRLRLAAVEGQPVSLLDGASRPYTTAINVTATGRSFRGISYRNTGVQADATVAVSPDKVVTVDLKLSYSYFYTPENGVALGADENGKPVLATEFVTASLNTKLEIASGKAQAAEGVKTVAKSLQAHTIVIVGARIIDADAKPEK